MAPIRIGFSILRNRRPIHSPRKAGITTIAIPDSGSSNGYFFSSEPASGPADRPDTAMNTARPRSFMVAAAIGSYLAAGAAVGVLLYVGCRPLPSLLMLLPVAAAIMVAGAA